MPIYKKTKKQVPKTKKAKKLANELYLTGRNIRTEGTSKRAKGSFLKYVGTAMPRWIQQDARDRADEEKEHERSAVERMQQRTADHKERIAKMKADAFKIMVRPRDIQKELDDCLKSKKRLKKKLKTATTNGVKKVVKKNTGGLASWQVFLNNYRSQNPNISYREAQRNASVLYKN
jgi:hypothetical protein